MFGFHTAKTEAAMTVNCKILLMLEKANPEFVNNKRVRNIVKKLKKGKNLKNRDFGMVYLLLREQSAYH